MKLNNLSKKTVCVLASSLLLTTTLGVAQLSTNKEGDNKVAIIETSKDSYSYDAYVWARANELIYKNTNEGLDRNINVYETIYILWKYEGKPIAKVSDNYDISKIKDINNSIDMQNAMNWAYSEGLIDNNTNLTGTYTRWRILELLYKLSTDKEYNSEDANKFNDVKTYNNNYIKALVSWGVKNDIALGFTNNEFKPEKNASVRHMITFLYRFSNLSTEKAKNIYNWLNNSNIKMENFHKEYLQEKITIDEAWQMLYEYKKGTGKTSNSGETNIDDYKGIYKDATKWAVRNNLVFGDDLEIAHNNNVYREGFIRFLYMLHGDNGEVYDVPNFDGLKGSDFENALYFAKGKGIVIADKDNTFELENNLTRAKAIEYLYLYDQVVKKENVTE